MGAWNKLFSNTNVVKSTVTVKTATGVTKTARLNVGAAGLSDADFADAGRHGATLSESRKDVNAAGETVTKKNTIKGDDISPREAHAAVCDLLNVVDPVPEKVRKRADGVPSENGNGKPDGAKS